MESADHFTNLFSYDMWANEQVWLTLKEHPEFEYAKLSVGYLSHIFGAQELWYKRIKGLSLDNLEVWPDYELTDTINSLKKYHDLWIELINTNKDKLDRIISYQNTKGNAFDTKLSDILQHVVIHGQHHRAQIAILLRNAKITPPGTDFIFFDRAN
jgi:uncharacterized damage-inducible protein DinB